MPKKSVNEATIAPPPVSDASVPEIKKTRKKTTVASVAETPVKAAAPRRKAAVKIVEESTNTSIGQLADAVGAREIEERAYQSWIERGCPMGSPEEDWYRAERELIARFATASR